MAYSVQAFADSSTSVFTDERYPLGTVRYETETEVESADASLVGPRVLVFIQAGAAISANELVEKNASATSYVGKPSAASAGTHPFSLLGVAVVVIALNLALISICLFRPPTQCRPRSPSSHSNKPKKTTHQHNL